MNFENLIQDHLKEAHKVLQNCIESPDFTHKVNEASEVIVNSLQKDGKIISCGNGGSHCDAMHFAEELTGRYRESRPGIAAIAVSDPSHITCVSNDFGFKYIFSRYIESIGREGDVLLAISTSGNSENLIEAVRVAKKKGIFTVGLTGKDGGKMADLLDYEIRVPHFGYADRIQEIHIKIIHILIDLIESKLGYK